MARSPWKLALLAASTLLLTLAFSPYSQFYLAWIAMAPWLLAVRHARSSWTAFFWGLLGGVLFFGVTLTWLLHATFFGMIGLILFSATFWGLAGGVLRRCRLLEPDAWNPIVAVLLIAATFTGAEWLRGWVFSGFPWMLIGISQTPWLAMCQIADITGVLGVSFWVLSINALVALAILTPQSRWRRLVPATIVTIALLAIVFGYGSFRLNQNSIVSGPRVMVVQPDFHHARGGARTVTLDEEEAWHFAHTEQSLAQQSQDVDLVVWSETVIHPMNPQARRLARDPRLSHGLHDDLLAMSRRFRTSFIFGAYALLSIGKSDSEADIRNATYLYSAALLDQPRYDKIHLVPYGESVPFKQSIPWLHKLMFKLAAYSVDYLITASTTDHLTVFSFPASDGATSWRCVTPICFEDIDGALVAQMFRPTPTEPDRKRADLIVNVSNDGWFRGNMRRQHLQNAIFRSIENRVPTARADNTGISGFVDSVGRMDAMLIEDTEGTSTRQVQLDSRLTFYTKYGDVFAGLCTLVTIGVFIASFFTKAPA